MTDKPDKPTAENEQAADPAEIHFLEATSIRFRFQDGRLETRLDGEEEWKEAGLARLFPLTEPEKWVSVLDKEGKEIGVLRDLRGLSPDSLACVREDLRRRYLVPEVRRIVGVRDRMNVTEWTVETDRGEVKFMMRHPNESIKQPTPGRITLTDVDGNRYDIPDFEELDPVSRRLLEERM